MAGTFTLFLPESNNKILPDTVEEGEMFGKGESAFDMCRSKRKSGTVENGTNGDIGMQNQAYNNDGEKWTDKKQFNVVGSICLISFQLEWTRKEENVHVQNQ